MQYDLIEHEANYSLATFPEPRPFQDTAHEKLRQGAREGNRCQMIMSPTGSGKCLGRDTPVLMADGTVKMVQDVVTGDRLIGPDGGVRNVMSVATGREQLYRITPMKGDSYIVNSSHILSLRKTGGSDGLRLSDGTLVPADADIVNINVETLLQSNATSRHCLKGWRANGIEFHAEKNELMLDPYWLGCWLGDGHQNMPALSSPECLMVDSWVNSAKEFGYEIVVIKSREGDCPSWRIVSRSRDHRGYPYNVMTMGLDFYGLRQRKHVPQDYKAASIQDRLSLIAGMIDSDGSLATKGFDWISKYKWLAEDFAFLCRSVGLAAYIQPCKKGIKSRGFVGDYWRVSVSGNTDIVPCLDKRAASREQKKRHLVHGINIEPIGVGDYFGFEIDGDNLFLLGDFTVTHNTYLGMRIIHEALKRGKRAMFVCDRTTLVNQTSEVADSYGLGAHSVIQSGHWRYDLRQPFQIASIQTLARRSWPEADVIVIDECFVGDTEISTVKGIKKIKDIVIGDIVHNSTGTGLVNSIFQKQSSEIITIGLSNGNKIRCTMEHPIFTEMGWRPAGSLVVGESLFCRERMFLLWDKNKTLFGENCKRSYSSRGREKLGKKKFLQQILLNENEKPNAFSRDKGESFISVEKNRPFTKGSRWKWKAFAGNTAILLGNIRRWLGVRVGSLHAEILQAGLSIPLQTRHCKQKFNDLHRTGWLMPWHDFKAGAGQEKRRAFEIVRVESITHSKQGRYETVYNLRVGGHPSYYANGILVHNCHSMYSAWTNHITDCAANVIGLSATPFSKGLGRLFTNLINAATMNELTQSGVLVPMRVYSCTKINMLGAETSGGEWKDSAAAERGMDIIGDVVTEWKKYAENRKTIVFGATINHCVEMCRQFNESGIMAATFTSDTTPEERRVLLDEYKKPDSLLRVLISVEALAKGFDVKDVGCICDCRPLRKSLSTAIQMWGRGLRSSPDTGKVDCIILDFSGNIIRFADDFSDIYYNGLDQLDAGEKLDKTIRRDDEEEKEPSKCPSCGFSPCGKRCISCGHEKQPKNLIEHLPGEMAEVMIGKSKLADDRKHLYEQVCTYTRSHGNPETAKQRAWYLFQDLTGGSKPANQWRFDDQPNTPITRATLNHITRKRIAFSKRKKDGLL